MGLFGSIGKVFGGALKVAGKVAGIASAVAPIPGLGFAGKVASAAGGLISKGKSVERAVGRVMPGGRPIQSIPQPNVMRTLGTFVTQERAKMAAIEVPPRAARASPPLISTPVKETAGGEYHLERLERRAEAEYAQGIGQGSRRQRKRRKKTRRPAARRAPARRKRGGRRKLTAAQRRAGFGGKRAMRRR